MKKKILVILSVFVIFLKPAFPADYHDNLRVNQMVFPIYPADSNYYKSELVDQLTEIINNNRPSNQVFPLFLDHKLSGTEIPDSLLAHHGLQNKIISDPNATINSQIRAGKNILILKPGDENFPIFTYENLRDQMQLTALDTFSTISDFEKPVFNYWHRTGRPPNILLAKDSAEYVKLVDVADKINYYPRLYGDVTYNGKPLDNVEWLELPGLVTSGKFTLPIHQFTRVHLSPVKEGFKFSPDIVYFIESTFHKERHFRAYLMDLREKMIADFSFDNEIANRLHENNDKLLIHNVQLVNDPERGKVAKFSGKTSYIDCDKTIDFGNQQEMTLAVWIKPDRVSGSHAFVGKGLDFSFKIHLQSPCFTTADIKDHFLPEIKIDSCRWQHIAMVVKENDVVKFYKNGELAGEVAASNINQSDKSVMIGTNLWEEYYSGYMDDLKLWDRALNSIEIQKLYHQPLESNPFPVRKVIYAIWVVLLLSVIIILRKMPLKALLSTNKRKQENAIYFFGNLKIIAAQSENLEEKLSPKMKQIFVLLLIHSIRNSGMTTKKLTDILWPGFSPAQAKNNRSTYFGKLRAFIKEIDGLELLYNNKQWLMKIGDSVFIDYNEVLKILSSDKKYHPSKLISLLSRGTLLPDIECDWLDEYRLELMRRLDDYLQQFFQQNNIRKQPETAYDLATQIKKFDSLNETALAIQINSQISLGNHSLAKKCYDAFAKEYEILYDTEYEKSFQDFIE